ncbi:ribonuclease H family protein [Shewanella sp. D64]|uniref:ribonuclease H family protein n=1 Tax=unclassified Shewanella TaxID=196818 RepID=UPI0022BA5A6B|nr:MULTISPECIES: ribonuclease H family protein [unclassified Shewanella]MEC4726945.1 ribonuclease H family protein [Shewanella sp. D64]MEC4738558.1 ribonuclease H family protein [Shewanella sp. E94]WBJ93776.1 ribonuclease H family protein [Shewanella sp. MTB7]
MASKYYVIWVGRKPGIYTSWDEAKQQVDKYPKAKYKSFKTRAEAETAFSKRISTAPYSKSPASISKSKSVTTHTELVSDSQYDVEIYTDGGCEPNPGKAGSGVAVYKKGILTELWYGLYNSYGTNNSAELNALHQALLIAKQALADKQSAHIRSDSQYSINCITNWAYSWKQKGWKRKVAGDIKNLEVIQASHALYEDLKDELSISHVAAHIGIEGNELADRMSIYAIDKKDTAFCRYPEPIDLASILSLRAG